MFFKKKKDLVSTQEVLISNHRKKKDLVSTQEVANLKS